MHGQQNIKFLTIVVDTLRFGQNLFKMQDTLNGDLHTCMRLEFLTEIDCVLCEVRVEAEDVGEI
jgi:hypothetical protein